jgi:hypothetical protein
MFSIFKIILKKYLLLKKLNFLWPTQPKIMPVNSLVLSYPGLKVGVMNISDGKGSSPNSYTVDYFQDQTHA